MKACVRVPKSVFEVFGEECNLEMCKVTRFSCRESEVFNRHPPFIKDCFVRSWRKTTAERA